MNVGDGESEMVVLDESRDPGIELAFQREDLLPGIAAGTVENDVTHLGLSRRLSLLACEELHIGGAAHRIERPQHRPEPTALPLDLEYGTPNLLNRKLLQLSV